MRSIMIVFNHYLPIFANISQGMLCLRFSDTSFLDLSLLSMCAFSIFLANLSIINLATVIRNGQESKLWTSSFYKFRLLSCSIYGIPEHETVSRRKPPSAVRFRDNCRDTIKGTACVIDRKIDHDVDGMLRYVTYCMKLVSAVTLNCFGIVHM